jgi:glycine C-acetyltransferase
MFDAIVVGARCAGAPTAMLLARKGHRVLLVDRARFPSDTLSTHFLWPRGATYLNKWGLLERVARTTPSGAALRLTIEGIRLEGSVPRKLVADRFRQVHGEEAPFAVDRHLCPRRRVLDQVLVDAAVEAGAELREGFTVDELLVDDGRVVGIRGRTASGAPVEERARVVIGADGRRSLVARQVGARARDVKSAWTFAYFSYFSGLPRGVPSVFRQGRLGMSVVPTNDDLHLVLVWGPHTWFGSFAADAEANFHRVVDRLDPETGERLRTEGRREDKFHGTADQQAYLRTAHGPGWALAGDAACLVDQCTASGMTHAFRDAELLAACLDAGLADRAPMAQALREYQLRKHMDTLDYYEFVADQAEMRPPRLDELEVFLGLVGNKDLTDAFFAAYGDTLRIGQFLSPLATAKVRREAKASRDAYPVFAEYEERATAAWADPFRERPATPRQRCLARTLVDFARPTGPALLDRTAPFDRFVLDRQAEGLWPCSRSLDSVAATTATIRGEDGTGGGEGLNFASQDYLSLNTHPAVREAAARALRDFGPHSAGSPVLVGNTRLSLALEAALADLVQLEHVVLFPTGWAAGFGAIAALVRPDDHVVLDRYAHACLQQGASASTRNVHRYAHCDVEAAEERLEWIRRRDAKGAILVVTEGLFSMDADWPDVVALQAVCRRYGATLLVDVAHDLGAMGPGGAGTLGVQQMLGQVDLVMGAFSKTFASNGGFLATSSRGVKQFVKMYGSPHTFSNALSPVQASVVTEAIRIVRSPEGDALRSALSRGIATLRATLGERGLTCLGEPSPIVPVLVGSEPRLRLAWDHLARASVHVNMVEFPAVPTGAARFRLQAMADHTDAHAREVAEQLARALDRARDELEAAPADDVQRTIAAMQARLRDLEAELQRLREQAADRPIGAARRIHAPDTNHVDLRVAAGIGGTP